MPEQTVAEAWGLVPAVLGIVAVGLVLGVVVTAVDRVVVFGAPGAAVEPIRSSARLLVEQRRTTLAPDRLLWRVGCTAVPTLALSLWRWCP
ncbi:hypothetical protein [Blastococcus brunescens]|uniref:Uncharacterized protein n=1 Tax=Blastococcus brunescens TaxID=1564165 RepID=A0ABZ1B4G1_9ACTN|nr:hypothetical protein [Blastococcus sp. BMG 8361]WRL65683.1 hypothetical protein U6N30_08930 [Blastococcus sp. BMG 8361]